MVFNLQWPVNKTNYQVMNQYENGDEKGNGNEEVNDNG